MLGERAGLEKVILYLFAIVYMLVFIPHETRPEKCCTKIIMLVVILCMLPCLEQFMKNCCDICVD